jgi:chemotaxis family two-component system response regulator Rcp1
VTNRDLSQRHILLIEDNAADVYLVKEMLRETGVSCKLDVLKDGDEALDYIERIDQGPDAACPDLMLLDLNLPRRNGAEILARLQTSVKCGSVPVIVLTSSDSPQDREMALRLGARHYFRKPPDLDRFYTLSHLISDIWASPT